MRNALPYPASGPFRFAMTAVDLIQTASPGTLLCIMYVIGKVLARRAAWRSRWRGVRRGVRRGGAGGAACGVAEPVARRAAWGAGGAACGVAPCFQFARASNARGETQQNFKITYSKRNNIS
jgi:hypothetical protein